MPPKEIKHQDHDLPMPDGTESESPKTATASPLDAEPATRAKPPRPRAPKAPASKQRVVREYVEDVASNPQEDEETSEFIADSPLDAEAEAALLMVEVDRVGPGEGGGWVGRLYDHGDGLGPQPVSYSRVGSFPDEQNIYERVQAAAGGGQYRFVRKGKKPVVKVLAGAPLPLPAEQQGYPNGATPNMRGGFERGYERFGEVDVDDEQVDPFDDPNYDPEAGVDPEQFTQSGFTGWFRGGPYNRLIYAVNGVPSRPPRGSRPPAALLNSAGAAGGYDPQMYDHSETKNETTDLLKTLIQKITDQPKPDPRLDRIERALEEKKNGGFFEAMMTMQLRQSEEAQRQRQHEIEMAKIKNAQDEAERKAKSAAEVAALTRQKELELEAIKAKAEAEKVTAQHNAEAMKANAAAAIASSEKIANIQAEANKQVLTAITSTVNKGDPVAHLTKGMELAGNLMGNKGTATEISGAIRDIVPTIADAAVTWKTGIAPSSGDPGATSTAGPSEDEMIERFVVMLVQSFESGIDPSAMPGRIYSACLVSGVEYGKIRGLISMASPQILAGQLDKIIKGAKSDENRKKFEAARASLVTERGQAWVAGLKSALNPKPQPQQVAPPVAPPPALPNGAAPPK